MGLSVIVLSSAFLFLSVYCVTIHFGYGQCQPGVVYNVSCFGQCFVRYLSLCRSLVVVLYSFDLFPRFISSLSSLVSPTLVSSPLFFLSRCGVFVLRRYSVLTVPVFSSLLHLSFVFYVTSLSFELGQIIPRLLHLHDLLVLFPCQLSFVSSPFFVFCFPFTLRLRICNQRSPFTLKYSTNTALHVWSFSFISLFLPIFPVTKKTLYEKLDEPEDLELQSSFIHGPKR